MLICIPELYLDNYALKGAITSMAIFGNDVTLVAGCDSSPAIKIFDAINGQVFDCVPR